VCHEGLLVRGKGFADLPAVVRSRTTAACQGRHSLSFWKHLGFSVSYELVKKGFSYTVYYDDFELEVLPQMWLYKSHSLCTVITINGLRQEHDFA